MEDPFASAPAQDEAQAAPPAPAESPFNAPPPEAPAPSVTKVDVKPNILPITEGKHVVTLKGGSGFDAPWYVVHASGLDELEGLFNGPDAARVAALLERIHKVAAHFTGLAPTSPNSAGAAPAPRQAAPQAAQGAPEWFPPAPGPGWAYRTGMKKDGSGVYHAWAPPRGSNEKWAFHNPR